MSQTSYSETPAKAFPGMLDAGPSDSLSRANGEGAEVKFGVGVVADAANGDTQFEAYGASGALLGVLRHEHQLASADASSVDDLAEATVVTKGRVWVLIDQDVAVGDPVFIRHTAGAGEVVGSFRMDADTADADELTSGVRWAQGGTAAEGVALLELNLPA